MLPTFAETAARALPPRRSLGATAQRKDVKVPRHMQSGALQGPNDLMRLLREWDRGSRGTRDKILTEFISSNKNKTGPQLEAELANGASLFLTRLTAWLRLTYLLGSSISLQLQAISVFISASSGHRFLAEFMEVGGVLTILEILGLDQVSEADKAESLYLLLSIAHAGRKYKELVCESYGIRVVAECLQKCRSEKTRDCARQLLQQLGTGNPRYHQQVYKALVSLLPSASPGAQQMAAQALRLILPNVASPAQPAIVEAVLSLLKSLYLQVQYEGCELLKELIKYEALQHSIVAGLVSLLKPGADELSAVASKQSDVTERSIAEHGFGSEDTKKKFAGQDAPGPLSAYAQQAAAAKMLGVLAGTSTMLAVRMVKLQVVHGLLVAMSNTQHSDSQKRAGGTLMYLIRSFPSVADKVRDAVGSLFFDDFMARPETIYSSLTGPQLEVLASNQVFIELPSDADFEVGPLVPIEAHHAHDVYESGSESGSDAESADDMQMAVNKQSSHTNHDDRVRSAHSHSSEAEDLPFTRKVSLYSVLAGGGSQGQGSTSAIHASQAALKQSSGLAQGSFGSVTSMQTVGTLPSSSFNTNAAGGAGASGTAPALSKKRSSLDDIHTPFVHADPLSGISAAANARATDADEILSSQKWREFQAESKARLGNATDADGTALPPLDMAESERFKRSRDPGVFRKPLPDIESDDVKPKERSVTDNNT